MATTGKALITAEQFMQMDLGDGTFELVRGEVIRVPPSMPEHGIVCGNVVFPLESFGRQTGYGYVLCNDSAVLTERAPDTVRGADVCFYSQKRWPRSEVGSGLPPVPPDLVVEVATSGDRRSEIDRKVGEYLRAGVPMVWVVDPKSRNLETYRPGDEWEPVALSESDTVEDLPELPGFRCRVVEFFV